MKLNNTQIKNAKAIDNKAYKLFDGGGLFLLVNAKGAKYWRLSLGSYTQISLTQAREQRDKVKQLIVNGIDLSVAKKQGTLKIANRFRTIADN